MRQLGMSLMDFMIALSISAVLLSAGVPAMQSMINNYRMTAAVNNLVTQFNLARNQAVTSTASVVVCPTHDQQICADSFEWQSGWLVFSDHDQDRERDLNEPIIQVGGPLPLTATSGRRNRFRFRFDGTALGSNGSLRLCDDRGAEHGRRLVISNVGRIRAEGPGIDRCS